MGDPVGLRLVASGPVISWIVTGPVLFVQVRVKGTPTATSNAVLVKAGRPLTMAMMPAKAAMVNFMAAVMFWYNGR